MALTDLLDKSAHGIPLDVLIALKRGYHEQLLAAGLTLDDTFPTMVGLDPGGAGRTIVLDGRVGLTNSADDEIDGLFRVLFNRADAAENLTVNDADANTIATLNQNDIGLFYHDGSSTGLGWKLMGVLTLSLT